VPSRLVVGSSQHRTAMGRLGGRWFRDFFVAALILGCALALFFRTYSPARLGAFDREGGMLVVLLGSVALLAILVRSFHAAWRRETLGVVLWLLGLWATYSVSTLTNLGSLPISNVIGLVNNLVLQWCAILIGVAIVWTFRDRLLAVIRWFAVFLIAFATLSAVIALQVWLTGAGLFGPFLFFAVEDRWTYQLYGWYASPNYLAPVLGLGLLSALYLLTTKSELRSVQWVLYVSILLLVSVLLLTGSRGGYVVTLGAVLSFWAISPTRRAGLGVLTQIAFLAVFVGGVVGALTLYFISTGMVVSDVFVRVLRMNPETLLTGTGRTEIWARLISEYAEGGVWKALFGWGNNYFSSEVYRSAHNSYLQLLFDHGVLTLVVFLAGAVGSLMFTVRRSVRYRMCEEGKAFAFLLALLVFSLLRGVFQGGELISFSPTWIVFLLALIFSTALRPKASSSERL